MTGQRCLEPEKEGLVISVSAKGGGMPLLERQEMIETTSGDVLEATHID